MAEIEAGSIVAWKFRLDECISEGGMGSVWLAQHLQLDAPVAIKFMHGSLLESPEALARFEREAKASARIRSPYVVHVHDHGIDEGVPFIVMEYLEGEDLGKRLKREKILSPAEVLRLCEQIAKGLERAHQQGIVHRDLKPGNVFLSKPDDDMVKLLDFGIAKETGKRRMVDDEVTSVGQVLGSPQYMSPEQARGQAVDGRSDLWSLAVILYRALTRRRPFHAADMGDLIVRICTEEVAPPSKYRPEFAETVDAFFERAFRRNPDDRFQSAKDFALGLRAAMAPIVDLHAVHRDSGTWPSMDDSGRFPHVPHPGGPGAPPDSSRIPDLATPPSGTAPSGSLSAVAGPASSSPTLAEGTSASSSQSSRRRRKLLVGGVAGGAVVVALVITILAFGGGDGAGVAEPEVVPAGQQQQTPPTTPSATGESSSEAVAAASGGSSAAATTTGTAAANGTDSAESPQPPPRRGGRSSRDVLGY